MKWHRTELCFCPVPACWFTDTLPHRAAMPGSLLHLLPAWGSFQAVCLLNSIRARVNPIPKRALPFSREIRNNLPHNTPGKTFSFSTRQPGVGARPRWQRVPALRQRPRTRGSLQRRNVKKKPRWVWVLRDGPPPQGQRRSPQRRRADMCSRPPLRQGIGGGGGGRFPSYPCSTFLSLSVSVVGLLWIILFLFFLSVCFLFFFFFLPPFLSVCVFVARRSSPPLFVRLLHPPRAVPLPSPLAAGQWGPGAVAGQRRGPAGRGLWLWGRVCP